MSLSYDRPIEIAAHCAAISNLGNTWRDTWRGLLAGRRPFVDGRTVMANWPEGPPISAITDLARFGEDPSFADRFAALARSIAADMRSAIDAIAKRVPRSRISIIIASSAGDPGCLSGMVDAQFGPGGSAVTRPMLEGMLGGPWADPITEALGSYFPATAVFGACASGLVGISYASDRINAGLTDVVLIIALDTLSRFACVGFNRIGAAAANGCRPYDRARNGTTVGEGAVGLLLARPGVLKPSEIAGRVAGAAYYCDASHLVEPSPHGVAQVINDAIGQAGITSSDIAGVYWHGTGTRQNDQAEAAAARIIFPGDRSPPCTSTKGALGHTMGASSAFNVLAACATFATGWMPHVAGTADAEFANLDLVLTEPRRIAAGPLLVTALGFGGIDAAAVLLPPLAASGASKRAQNIICAARRAPEPEVA